MINVCFAGITGWTAPPIADAIEAAGDLALTAGVSRSAAGQGLGELRAIRGVAAVPGVRRGLDSLVFADS